jgi:hypothetical protein
MHIEKKRRASSLQGQRAKVAPFDRVNGGTSAERAKVAPFASGPKGPQAAFGN